MKSNGEPRAEAARPRVQIMHTRMRHQRGRMRALCRRDRQFVRVSVNRVCALRSMQSTREFSGFFYAEGEFLKMIKVLIYLFFFDAYRLPHILTYIWNDFLDVPEIMETSWTIEFRLVTYSNTRQQVHGRFLFLKCLTTTYLLTCFSALDYISNRFILFPTFKIPLPLWSIVVLQFLSQTLQQYFTYLTFVSFILTFICRKHITIKAKDLDMLRKREREKRNIFTHLMAKLRREKHD